MDLPTRLPAFLKKPAKAILRATGPHPVIVRETCIGCGKCAEICPKRTIRIIEKKAVIEKKDCIRCFCCHEICPERAIDIRRGFRWEI